MSLKRKTIDSHKVMKKLWHHASIATRIQICIEEGLPQELATKTGPEIGFITNGVIYNGED